MIDFALIDVPMFSPTIVTMGHGQCQALDRSKV
jgi:hypothetical protein